MWQQPLKIALSLYKKKISAWTPRAENIKSKMGSKCDGIKNVFRRSYFYF